MPHRLSGAAPVKLVVALIGTVMVVSAAGVLSLALIGAVHSCAPIEIPAPLPSLALASMTGLTGLLIPTHGLHGNGRQSETAALAGEAAAHAVMEHRGLTDLTDMTIEADNEQEHKP